MSCVAKEQWKEVYDNEIELLGELAAEGYDIDEELNTLEEMNRKMMAGDPKGAAKVAGKYVEQRESLTAGQISDINRNKPMLANGMPLKIVCGLS